LVDFLDPALEEKLEAYAALPNVVAVREHLGWDAGNALRRFAKRPDLMTDPTWRIGLGALRRHGFKCGIEIFAPQLSDLPDVIRLYPDIGFTLSVLGWPLDLSPTGYTQWRQDLAVLSRCANVQIEIAAIECLFGMGWRRDEVAPWILSVIEMFGPARCMFGIKPLAFGLEVADPPRFGSKAHAALRLRSATTGLSDSRERCMGASPLEPISRSRSKSPIDHGG